MKVYCFPADRNSTYVPLLFDGIEDAFTPVYRQDGSLRDAIADLDAGLDVIVHIHWEEFALRECRTEAEADVAAAAFAFQIAGIRERRGPIVWTVHNEWPHEIPYVRQFLELRRVLARCADRILLHNEASRAALAAQVTIEPSRVRVLPHPSYIGRLENEAALRAGLRESPVDRRIQAFGWIRLQKGYTQMIDTLGADFLAPRGARIRISGHGPEAAAVVAQRPERTDVHWDLRHIPDAEIPALLRGAACVVLPYERVLTSGVALLAMSVGAMLVAVDFPQLRELLPPASRRFLYPSQDADALRRVIDDVFALSRVERRAIVDANVSIARSLMPSEIARRLALIYHDAAAQRRNLRDIASV